ncbi:probable helicase with zinc finger domain [Amia ocellicauda]|uniref:probable helicase with zinc finger domain n=1 Tax=Amia ocellicauda TaxID=2972642 RepID=UPI003464DAE8
MLDVSSSVDGVRVNCSPALHQTITEKDCSLSWTLHLHCNPPRLLYRVALLSALHRSRFWITGVAAGCADSLHPYPLSQPCREWSHHRSGQNRVAEHVYQVTLLFSTHCYGSFQQTVVFDFGTEPVLLQTVSTEVAPPQDPERAWQQQCGSVVSSVRWDAGCKQVSVVGFLPQEACQLDQSLLLSYRIPAAADQLFTRSVLDRSLAPYNYHPRLHDLLYIEENAQSKEVSK